MKKCVKILNIFLLSFVTLFLFVGCSLTPDGKIIKSLYLQDADESFWGTLPIMEINTQDERAPYNKETYVNCSFKISNCKNEEHNFEVEMKDAYGDPNSVGIRLRGNSTIVYDKKPYRIKFDKKTSLLGMEKNKSWVLLANYLDQSSIRNYTAFTMADMFDNLGFSPTPNHVVLFLNGKYQGLYLLTEQIDEKSGRAGVEEDFDPVTDIEFPFLIEMDRMALNEGVTGIDNFQIEGLFPIEIKYPEQDARGIEEGEEDVVFNYIHEYVSAVYQTLKTNNKVEVSFRSQPVSFEDLVDVNSFIDYHLLMEFMFNTDAYWGSIYMSKSKNGKMIMGPIWDFDLSQTNEWTGTVYEKSYIDIAQKLYIAKKNPLFNLYLKNEDNFLKVQTRWNEVSPKYQEINNKLREYKKIIESPARKNATYWYGKTGEFQFDMQYDYVRLFLIDRHEFLNTALNLSYTKFLELIN